MTPWCAGRIKPLSFARISHFQGPPQYSPLWLAGCAWTDYRSACRTQHGTESFGKHTARSARASYRRALSFASGILACSDRRRDERRVVCALVFLLPPRILVPICSHLTTVATVQEQRAAFAHLQALSPCSLSCFWPWRQRQLLRGYTLTATPRLSISNRLL